MEEFLPETIVSLHGEFGVVLNKKIYNGIYGLIRWDTERENDVEDWCGLFGTFLQVGGEVIEDHHFNFINRDGTSKHSKH